MSQAFLKRITAISFFALLTACGGGGGGGADTASASGAGVASQGSGASSSDGSGSGGTTPPGGTTPLGSTTPPGGITNPATAARFAGPITIVSDAGGILYVGDWNDNTYTIRKIASDGRVTTLATDREIRADDFTVDSSGNIYLIGGNAILKITPAGAVSNFAGLYGTANEGYGFADGTGTGARFSSLRGITADRAGNLYVADSENHAIRRITPAGVVSTVYQGTAPSAGATYQGEFIFPGAMSIDASGVLYISALNAIWKFSGSGAPTVLAGMPSFGGSASSQDGSASNARFAGILSLTVDSSGIVYVGETEIGGRPDFITKGVVRRVTPAGVVTTLAGNYALTGSTDGTGPTASFSQARGVAVRPDGNIYVSDTYGFSIRRVTSSGVVTTYAGKIGEAGSADSP